MRNFKTLAVAAFALSSFLLLAATPAQADPPKYLHALADLRQARAWVNADGRPQFAALRKQATDQIHLTIADLKKAAIDDGENPDYTPPPQSSGDASHPIRSALKLLDEAYKDIEKGQDIPQNLGLQVRSLQHLDAARTALKQIIQAE